MFTSEDYERAESIAPYGIVEESTGSGSFSWYRNPMWGMTQIGSFPEYYLSEYGDWVIENLKDEVEDNGFDVGRYSRKVLVDRKSISYTNWWFKIFHLVLPMVDDRCLIDFIEIFVDTIN